MQKEKHTATAQEVSEGTLKRLHTLGIQKFGSSPFSAHFDRWLTNLAAVLSEFESNPNIAVDDEFVRESTQTFSIIKLQLENLRRREASVNQEIRNMSDCSNRLEQIKVEFKDKLREVRLLKNGEIKRLYSSIDRLKRDQDRVIRIQTGFFRGISKKEREHREAEITQELKNRQRELELAMLDFNAAKEDLRAEYERKKEPVAEQKKHFQKIIENAETDGSLEERWLACEALIDAVNTLLQRKASQGK
jgi:hypothetical protein